MRKNIFRVVTVIILVVMSLVCMIVPSFAYFDTTNMQAGQRANYVQLPIKFSRATVRSYSYIDTTLETSYDVLTEVDLPTEVNKLTSVTEELATKVTNISVPLDSFGALSNSGGFAQVYTEYDNDVLRGNVGVNVHNDFVLNTQRQRLELYADSAIFYDEDLFNGFFLTVNDIQSVTSAKITFSIMYPTLELYDDPLTNNGYDYDGVSFSFEQLANVSHDLPLYSETTNSRTFKILDSSMIEDYTWFDSDTNESYPCILTDIKIVVDVQRWGYTPNANDDFSFFISQSVYSGGSYSNLIDFDYYLEVPPIIIENGGGSGDINFNDVSVVEWAVTQINSILKIEILPYISIGALLWFVVGLSLFFFTLKMFLGG